MVPNGTCGKLKLYRKLVCQPSNCGLFCALQLAGRSATRGAIGRYSA
jgi:hypothetical protein